MLSNKTSLYYDKDCALVRSLRTKNQETLNKVRYSKIKNVAIVHVKNQNKHRKNVKDGGDLVLERKKKYKFPKLFSIQFSAIYFLKKARLDQNIKSILSNQRTSLVNGTQTQTSLPIIGFLA